MKKRNAWSLLLSLALLLAAVLPATTAHAEDTGSDNGMHISKTAEANHDGSYTITLEAYATGSKIISEVTKDIPTDIVLVLDQSGSMAYCITCGKEISRNNQTHNVYAAADTVSTSGTYYVKTGSSYTRVYHCDGTHSSFGWSRECTGGAGWYTSTSRDEHTPQNKITPETTQFYVISGTEACTSRLAALKTAVTNFAGQVAQKAAGADGDINTVNDNIHHRIAVVGYADTDWSYGYNTGILIGSTLHRYETGAAGVYGTAFQDMSTAEGTANVTASIEALQASGATRTDYGLTMANGILNANPVPSGEKRNCVVIVFTDGSPTSFNGFEKAVANSAISTANSIKSGGATVYSVGIFAGADATSAGTEPSQDLGQNSSQMSAACNWFMQQVSSNNGTPQSPSYYLSAGDAGSLNSIFKQISDQIETGGSASTLTSAAVVKDIISPQFTLPDGADGSSIMLETYACIGKDNNGAYLWSKNPGELGAAASISKDTVSVTGFDFSENYVGTVTENGEETYRGSKLVIRFHVQPKDGFLGGNNVFTNTNAGIYETASSEEPLLTFEKPAVNVPIPDVTVTAEDQNVYLLGEVTADALKKGATVKVGNVALDLEKADENYGLEDWQTEYVGIKVEIKDEDGNTIPADGLKNLTDDTTYTVTATVAPKEEAGAESSGAAATEKTGETEANINVFKPELTFKDSTAYYGESIPENNDYSANKTAEAWKHGDTASTDTGITMHGAKPKLDITYTPDGEAVKDGKYTKQDVLVLATVKIGNTDVMPQTTFEHADGEICDYEGHRSWPYPASPENAAFAIHIKTCTLSITKKGGAADESYVFDVYKDGQKYSEAAVWGNGTETLAELPVGTYTIQENAGWSWRYLADNGSAVTLSAQNPTGSITCTNTKNVSQWLNGFSEIVRNIFTGHGPQ